MKFISSASEGKYHDNYTIETCFNPYSMHCLKISEDYRTNTPVKYDIETEFTQVWESENINENEACAVIQRADMAYKS